MPAPTDNFSKFPPQLIGPADNAFAITVSDSANLTFATRAIYVGTGGNVRIDTTGGQTNVTFVNVQSGSYLDIRAIKVKATGTTANNLLGLY